VIQIQERSLRALEEHPLSTIHLSVQIRRNIGKKGDDVRCGLQALVSHRDRIKRRASEQRGGNAVLLCHDLAAAATKQLRVAKVAGPQPAAARLVLVSGADPFGRRADLPHASRLFRGDFVSPMVRQNQVRPIADDQAPIHSHTVSFHGLDLAKQGLGIHHNSIPNNRRLIRPHDACWEKLKNKLLAANVNRVARIRASLISSHNVKVLRQSIDDFAFAFVAPLSAHDNYVCWHIDPLGK
jgi:hypothetical protein